MREAPETTIVTLGSAAPVVSLTEPLMAPVKAPTVWAVTSDA
jgi:hypothetical protein